MVVRSGGHKGEVNSEGIFTLVFKNQPKYWTLSFYTRLKSLGTVVQSFFSEDGIKFPSEIIPPLKGTTGFFFYHNSTIL